jgi:hypothetical protein
MSRGTVNQRRALSILFLIGGIFLVAAVWNSPSQECNADDVRRLKNAALENSEATQTNPPLARGAFRR